MNFTKIVSADLDFPRQKLSNGGLGIVVALSVFLAIDFLFVYAGVQSSCNIVAVVMADRRPP